MTPQNLTYFYVLCGIWALLIIAILLSWYFRSRSNFLKNQINISRLEKDMHDIEHKVNETPLTDLIRERNKRKGPRA